MVKFRPGLQASRIALEGISAYAGNYRSSEIKIEGSVHQPIGAHLVPEKVEELCDYVNEHWDMSAIHLAAYVMWRLNWIHPFADGNGRTSRALSYLVLCIRLGQKLPGTLTIPDQISRNKTPYYVGLESADSAFRNGAVEVNELERLLKNLLAAQLLSVVKAADEPGKSKK